MAAFPPPWADRSPPRPSAQERLSMQLTFVVRRQRAELVLAAPLVGDRPGGCRIDHLERAPAQLMDLGMVEIQQLAEVLRRRLDLPDQLLGRRDVVLEELAAR